MIRVLVVAGSNVIRAGLEVVVRSSSELELAGVANFDQFTDAIHSHSADALLIDVPHLDEDWVATLTETSIPVVVLTEDTVEDATLLASALHANVRSILSMDATATEITSALRAAASDLITLQPSTFELFAADSRPALAPLEEPLSSREIEVVRMLAEGLTNKVIAYRLGISEHTVKFHVTSIMGKLHAGSHTDAVMQAIRRGLVMI